MLPVCDVLSHVRPAGILGQDFLSLALVHMWTGHCLPQPTMYLCRGRKSVHCSNTQCNNPLSHNWHHAEATSLSPTPPPHPFLPHSCRPANLFYSHGGFLRLGSHSIQVSSFDDIYAPKGCTYWLKVPQRPEDLKFGALALAYLKQMRDG